MDEKLMQCLFEAVDHLHEAAEEANSSIRARIDECKLGIETLMLELVREEVGA